MRGQGLGGAPSCACAIVLLGLVGCSGKDRPASLPDQMTGMAGAAGAGGTSTGAGGGIVGQNDSGSSDGASSDGGEGLPGNGGDFTKCWADVMSQRGIVADPWFCASTTTGHPANQAVYRNLLYPAVAFAPVLDMQDRQLEVTMAYDWAWTFMIRVPQGEKLAASVHTTNAANDSAIAVTWDHGGTCGGAPESGSFVIYKIEWDAMNVLTTAEIDFVHRCGDSTPLYGRFRLNSKRPP